jgi:hypothetical protein
MDLPLAILPHPERPFGPGEPGVTSATGRRDRRDDTAGPWIDLLNAILGELVQMLAVECRPGMRGDLDRAQCLSTGRIERVQRVAGCKPDMLAVIADAVHLVDTGEGVLTNDLCSRSVHDLTLVDRQRSGE